MLGTLLPHPATPPSAVERIEVEVEFEGETRLRLTYVAFGDMSRLKLPAMAEAGRADELWRHTCFEAFVGIAGRPDYLELNFAGLQWAAYRFSGYRGGMETANIQPWSLVGRTADDHFRLEIEIDIGRMARPDLPAPDRRLGLSAVIEDVDGNISYWALAHPSDKPDFHHPDSFVLDLP